MSRISSIVGGGLRKKQNSSDTASNNIEFGDEYFDEDSGETLNVWDAADIYLSNGCDEDYSFGYTHEELMETSGNGHLL